MVRLGWLRGWVGSALVLVLLAGCGQSGTKVYPVRGKLVYKGKGGVAWLAGGQVHFESVAEPKVTASGEIEEDGSFAVWSYVDRKDREGLPAGEYRVCVIPPGRDGDDEAPRRVGLLHPRYQNFDTSKLSVTVTPGANTPTVEVEAGR